MFIKSLYSGHLAIIKLLTIAATLGTHHRPLYDAIESSLQLNILKQPSFFLYVAVTSPRYVILLI